MSLDASLPSDSETTLDEFGGLLRETREAINATDTAVSLLGGSITSDNDLVLTTGETELVNGDDLFDQAIEVVNLTASGLCSISLISGGRGGQLKIFKFGDANITFVNSVDIVLNRTGNLLSYSGLILGLINSGGDGNSIPGTWTEAFCSDSNYINGVKFTAAGKALLDDANAAAQLVTLGITATSANINSQMTSLVASGITQADLTNIHTIVDNLVSLNPIIADLLEAQASISNNIRLCSSYATIHAALADIGSTVCTLIIDESITLTENVIIPSTLCVNVLPGCTIDGTNTYTFTCSGNFISGFYLVFINFASGSVTFSIGTIEYAYAEWWGAVAKLTKLTAIDCTNAIKCAIATGKSVKLLDGYYGFRADSANAFNPRFDGQKFIGSGRRMADANGGTYLYKLSGSYPCLYVGAFGGMEVGDFTIDGNDLAGSLISMVGTYYSGLHNIHFKGQGGTDFALYLDDWNVCEFGSLTFDNSCYAGIGTHRTASAGYSSFIDIIIGTTIGDSIYFGNYCTSMLFQNLIIETPVTFEGIAESISFDILGIETASDDVALFSIIGSGIKNVSFKNVRLYRSALTTYPEFDIVDAKNISFDGIFVQDLNSASGHDIISLNGAYGISVKNSTIYSANSLDLIECIGIRSDYIDIENVNYVSGAAAVCKWKTMYLTVKNSNLNHEWVSGSGSWTTFINCGGTFTLANIGAHTEFINCPYTPVIIFSSGDTSPSVKTGKIFYTNNGSSTTITMFDDGVTGKEIWIVINDEHTTIDFSGTNLKGNDGSDHLFNVGDCIHAIFDGTNWYCNIVLG